MKSPKQQFCESLAWPAELDLHWFDLKAVGQIDEDRKVTVTLVSRKVHDHYEAVQVDIVSKTHGRIDTHTFAFADYLSGRADSRTDYRSDGYEVVAHCGWKWYIAVPESTAPLTAAVAEYVSMFR